MRKRRTKAPPTKTNKILKWLSQHKDLKSWRSNLSSGALKLKLASVFLDQNISRSHSTPGHNFSPPACETRATLNAQFALLSQLHLYKRQQYNRTTISKSCVEAPPKICAPYKTCRKWQSSLTSNNFIFESKLHSPISHHSTHSTQVSRPYSQ